ASSPTFDHAGEHLDNGLLAPRGRHSTAHAPPHGLPYHFEISPAFAWNAAERSLDGGQHDLLHRLPVFVFLRYAVDDEQGIARELAAPGERERNDDDADEGELTPLAYRAFAGLHDQASVAEQSADRRIVDDAHGPRRKPHHL